MSRKQSKKISKMDGELIVEYANRIYIPTLMYLEDRFQDMGLTIKETTGEGLELVILLGNNSENEIMFYIRNLILEIVTIDRDEYPYKFDFALLDDTYFVNKCVSVTESKIKALVQILISEGEEEIKKNLGALYDQGGYERLRWQNGALGNER